MRSRSLGWGLEYLCYSLELKNRVEALIPSSVLDVGCGDGRFLGFLDSGIERKLGVDLSERAIDLARAFHREIDYQVLDVANIEETFDVVTLIEVLEHIPDELMTTFLQAVYRRIRPGGSLLLSVPTKVMPFVGKHYRHYDEAMLKQAFEVAEISTEALEIDYLIPQKLNAPTWLLEKLAYNRWWTFEFRPLQRLLWASKWSTRITNSECGRHLVAKLVKS